MHVEKHPFGLFVIVENLDLELLAVVVSKTLAGHDIHRLLLPVAVGEDGCGHLCAAARAPNKMSRTHQI